MKDKKKNLGYLLRTAGIVLPFSLVLTHCAPKSKYTEKEIETFVKDSLQNNAHYRLANIMIKETEKSVSELHDVSTQMCIWIAENYIKRNVKDIKTKNFMLNVLKYNAYNLYYPFEGTETAGSEDIVDNIKQNYAWFDELMKYLTGQYSDSAFCGNMFFDVMNNQMLKEKFTKHAKQIEEFQKTSSIAKKQSENIYNSVYNYAKQR